MFSLKKSYPLAGFEPGSSVPEEDAMSTASCRQGWALETPNIFEVAGAVDIDLKSKIIGSHPGVGSS
jgi:hypothetical protein